MKCIWKPAALVVMSIVVALGCSPDGHDNAVAPTAPQGVPLLADGMDLARGGDLDGRRIRPVIAVYWHSWFNVRDTLAIDPQPVITAGLAGEIAEGRVLLYQTQYIEPDLCLVSVEIPLAIVDSIVACRGDSLLWVPEL